MGSLAGEIKSFTLNFFKYKVFCPSACLLVSASTLGLPFPRCCSAWPRRRCCALVVGLLSLPFFSGASGALGKCRPTPTEQKSGFFLQWTPWPVLAIAVVGALLPPAKGMEHPPGVLWVLSILLDFTVR